MAPTRLDVGAVHTEVRTGHVTTQLGLGWVVTPQACFCHDPPTPAELERAIDVVEDEVMRTHVTGPSEPLLHATGDALREVANAAGGADRLTLDTVEQLFQRIASVSLGDPSAGRGLPAGVRFVATLLILREFLHHGGFSAVDFANPPS
jgi:exopolyphosphatase/pppGpp-phosphohydrolase